VSVDVCLGCNTVAVGREEVSRYLGHSSTDATRRYARHTPETLGAQAAEALAERWAQRQGVGMRLSS
jgi:integrase